MNNEKSTTRSKSSLWRDWILEADRPDKMQSDYKIVGFNLTPCLQQVLLLLLAFSQFQDTQVLEAVTCRCLFKATWLRQGPALRNRKSQKAGERSMLEFCNLWHNKAIKESFPPSPNTLTHQLSSPQKTNERKGPRTEISVFPTTHPGSRIDGSWSGEATGPAGQVTVLPWASVFMRLILGGWTAWS